MKENFRVSLGDWKGAARNTLVQGLNVHRLSGTYIGHQADDVAGQAEQDVVFRQNKYNGDYLGAITVKKAGHGSSTGLEDYDANTVRCWFGHEYLDTSGYVQFDIGDTGVKPFVKMDLPRGDIEIDNDNNRLVLRTGILYRIYDFQSVKANQRKKLAEFTIPVWGKRWQGMFLVEGRLLIHSDMETKGASRARMYDLEGNPVNFPGTKQNWIDTTDMGDEAEGFYSEKVNDDELVYAMKRTGGAGAKRILEGTFIVKLPKNSKPWDGKSFPGAEAFNIGSRHPAVKLLGERLVYHGWDGYKSGPGIPMSETDKAGVRWWQLKQGWTGSGADGIPGKQTWATLMADKPPAPKPPVAKPPTTPKPATPKEDPVAKTLVAYYPPADRKVQWYPNIVGGATFTRVDKFVLHTTEGNGWFNYGSVGFGPHLTYNPKTREWRQHMPLNRSATALADPSSTPVRENQDNVIQVEVVGFAKDGADWSLSTCEDIGALVKFLGDYGLLAKCDVPFTGPNTTERMTSSEWDAYKGIAGHQHVSGNDHWDPGKIPVDKILAAAKGESVLDPGTTTPPADRVVFATPFKVETPVPTGEVGYAYGTPDNGYAAKYHTGQDFKGRKGAPCLAVWSGVVRLKPLDKNGYGNYLVLEADNGRDYYYCHLDRFVAKNGERVIQGQEIGKLGTTGNSTGPHLHLEDRPRGGAYGEVRKPDWPTWDGRSFVKAFIEGQSHPAVVLLGQRLVAHLGAGIYQIGPGPKFGEADIAACRKFQENQGWSGSDADGIPGQQTWTRLMTPRLSS